VFEAPGVIASLGDLAVLGDPIEQRRRYLGVGKDLPPFGEGEGRY